MPTLLTPIAELDFDDKESILHVRVLKGADMNLENTLMHYKKINELVGKKNHRVLVDAANYLKMEKAAWLYASKKEVISNRVAVAHYNSCNASRLETVFFKTTLKTAMAVEIFDSKEKAVKWLRSIPV